MMWNWYTVDSCFISSTWHNTSSGMFAGSCIGVILLVMSLEFLRRSVKEYDAYLIRKHCTPILSVTQQGTRKDSGSRSPMRDAAVLPSIDYRPNIMEQTIRAFLHMVQFAVAYFVMLLAMYYNGYIIVCIFIGAFLGAFVFQWEKIGS